MLFLKNLLCFLPITVAFTQINTLKSQHILKKNIKTYALPNNNTMNDHSENNDFIESYSNWLGLFPPEKKWKSVRFTIYSFITGYAIGESIHNLIHYWDNSNLDF
tara:strand:- start:12838 stop:13152 length:315 start_codon:yes stop_codon:yes gene_type:complete